MIFDWILYLVKLFSICSNVNKKILYTIFHQPDIPYILDTVIDRSFEIDIINKSKSFLIPCLWFFPYDLIVLDPKTFGKYQHHVF